MLTVLIKWYSTTDSVCIVLWWHWHK